MDIPYSTRSRFFDAVDQAIQVGSEPLQLSVNLGPGGYERDAIVEIRDTDTFATNWESPQPSRFSARLRAAATVLLTRGYRGKFMLSHHGGVLSIRRLSEDDQIETSVPFRSHQKRLAPPLGDSGSLERGKASRGDVTARYENQVFSSARHQIDAGTPSALSRDLDRFYSLIAELGRRPGQSRMLREYSGFSGLPSRGIYFFGEQGEHRAGSVVPRIVRVGTHAVSAGSRSTLWDRLRAHRGQRDGGGNHRGSIFRLHVGAALQKRDGDSIGYLQSWGSNRSAPREVRAKEADLERRVSAYLGRTTLRWLPIDDEPGPMSLRSYVERNAIALLSNQLAPLDPPSPKWLGSWSDRLQIRQSGLWNVDFVESAYDPAFLVVMSKLMDAEHTCPSQRRPHSMSQTHSRLRNSKRIAVVIQCAGSKRSDAERMRTAAGQQVMFFGQPEIAPLDAGEIVARPDERGDRGMTWREELLEYNLAGSNPWGLKRAFDLYKHPVYAELVGRYGLEDVYILSAGWGLIRADFLTPLYDITFSGGARAEPWKIRRQGDVYRDFCHLPDATYGRIVFFGGHDYVPLFASLTKGIQGERAVYYRSKVAPNAPGCELVRYQSASPRNWQYDCARAFMRADAEAVG